MGGINYQRVLVGGVVAGIVFIVADVLFPIFFSGPANAWLEAMGFAAPAGGAMAVALVTTLVIGIIAVWLYAAMRPRLGAGPTSAVYAGLVIWALAVAAPSFYFAALGMSMVGFWTYLIWWLIFAPLGAVAGAWAYREGPEVAAGGQAAAAPAVDR